MATVSCGAKLSLNDKKLTEIYGVSKTDAKFTCYCHHFTKEGKHCVLNDLGPEAANQCKGVLYAETSSAIGNFFGVSSLTVKCGPQRGTHKMCRPDNCPYVKAGEKCPFSIEKDAK